MKKFIYSMIAMLGILMPTSAWAADTAGDEGTNREAYVEFIVTADDAYMTFYYDDKKSEHTGGAAVVNVDDLATDQSIMQLRQQVYRAVFNQSFADARPTSTKYWFGYCFQLKTIEGLEYLNTSEVTDMSEMFIESGVDKLNLSTFATSKVTTMNRMFAMCRSLVQLDLSSFDTSEVTDMEAMFNGCESIVTIYAGDKWSTGKVTDTTMFGGCSNLVGGNGTTYSEDNMGVSYARIDAEGAPGYFTRSSSGSSGKPEPYAVLSEGNTVLTFYYDEQKEANNGMSVGPFSTDTDFGWNSARSQIKTVIFDESFVNCQSITSTQYWFYNFATLTEVKGIEYLKTDNVTTMRFMFDRCASLTSLDLSTFNTENVEDMAEMFYGCSKLTELNVSRFNTSNVREFVNMFYGCNSLSSLNVSSFNTENSQYMGNMFNECELLTSLDVSNFNTANVKEMNGMFMRCKSLTSLDISSFDTEKVTSMSGMFYECTNLQRIYVGDKWSTTAVTDDTNMFTNSTNLVGGAGTKYDENYTGVAYAHIDGGTSNPGYLTDVADKYKPLSDGDIFEAETEEGITLKFRVISAEEKTCQVGTERPKNTWSSTDAANAVDVSVAGKITIPEIANGYTVIEIGFQAFMNCHDLTSLIIPNTVKTISNVSLAFTGLTSITIPGSVSEIDNGFITECNIESITVESGNQIYDSRDNCNAIIETATEKLVKGCKNSIVPQGIKIIGPQAFLGIKGLKTIELPNTVTTIGVQAFNSGDLSSIELPSSLKTIGYAAFAGSKLTSIVIPASVDSIDYSVFSNVSTLYSLVVDPNNPVFDSRDNCNAIIETATNTLVEGIGTTVIPNTVTAIKTLAFNDVNLWAITIPASVKSIGEYAFSSSYLEEIISEIETPFEIPDNVFYNTTYSRAVLYVPAGSIQAYRNTPAWSNFQNIQETAKETTFEGSVLTVDGQISMATALEQVGGRAEVAKTIAAIVWNSSEPLTRSDVEVFGNPNLLVYVKEASMAPEGVNNVVINGTAKSIVLVDADSINNNFFVPQEFVAERISYTREFKQTTQKNVSRGWEGIALPFTVQQISHELHGIIAPFGSDGSNFHFWLHQMTDKGLTSATTIEANKPYIISMPNSSEYPDLYNQAGLITFESKNVKVPVTEYREVWNADGTIAMIPTFQKVESFGHIYALNVGKEVEGYVEGSVFVNNYRNIRPFEVYTFHEPNHNSGSGTRAISVSSLFGDGTGTTGIEGVTPETVNADAWYDLSGRKLQGKPTKSGVYINSGKKVVIE